MQKMSVIIFLKESDTLKDINRIKILYQIIENYQLKYVFQIMNLKCFKTI